MMIYIFGDSYSDLYSNSRETYNSWPKLLNRNFDVRNYSKSGKGPQYCFKNFFSKLNNFTLEDIIIFILSDPDRIEFFPHETQNFGYDFKEDLFWNNSEKDLTDVEFFYETYKDELKKSNLKNLGFLKSLNIVKKIIVFYSFKDALLKNSKYINDDKFYFYKTPLENISNKELYINDYNLRIKEGRKGRDLRANHFSEQNHLIFYEMLKDIINNKIKENYNFHQNFRSLQETFIGKFIYE